MEIVNYFNYWS